MFTTLRTLGQWIENARRTKGASLLDLESSRIPHMGRDLLVVERSGFDCRAARTTFSGKSVFSEVIAAAELRDDPRSAIVWVLNEARSACGSAVVVTSEAVPSVVHRESSDVVLDGRGVPTHLEAMRGGQDLAVGWATATPSRGRAQCSVITAMPCTVRQAWMELLDEAGFRPAGFYPLLVTPLAGIGSDSSEYPELTIQLEVDGIAVIESLAGRCRGVEIYAEVPSVRRCVELIGEACEEVRICGRGVNLSAFGYELVRAVPTWIRIASSDASIVGAARHVFGLAPTDAVASIPCNQAAK